MLLYFTVFCAIQVAVQGTAMYALPKIIGRSLPAGALAPITVASGTAVIAVFAWRRWTATGTGLLRQQGAAAVLAWAAMAAVGAIVPVQLVGDLCGAQMPHDTVQALAAIMGSEWGWWAVGLVTPIAEEMVFRGAITRALLAAFGNGRHWWAIAIGACTFGAVHGNMPQFISATLVGLLLGWLFYRTHSIWPGVVLHTVNNSISYTIFKIMPGSADMRLIDFFGGDWKRVALLVACALCVLVPSLLQLGMRTAGGLATRHRRQPRR